MTPLRITLLFLVSVEFVFAQPCLPEGITFTNQQQIDEFALLYPNCTIIEGDVKIGDFSYPFSSTDIINLSGLSNITQINGNLNIFYNGQLATLTDLTNLAYISGALSIDNNDLLVNLTGLENLSFINGTVTVKSNDELINFSGLNNISHIGNSLYISSNPSLISLEGLDSLESISGYLSIANNDGLPNLQGLNMLNSVGQFIQVWSNDNLENLQGLEQLNFVGGFVKISNNDELISLSGLQYLQQINGYLSIHDNVHLTSIDGIENIDPNMIQSSSGQSDIEIYNNLILSSCALDVVCTVFNSPDKNLLVYNNGSDCESISDIDSICNPACGIVENLNNSGTGSLSYNLECIAQFDTIFFHESLEMDTFWLSDQMIDYTKSFVLKGPANRVCIAASSEAPLLHCHTNEVIHLININLITTSLDTAIQSEGTIILEDSDWVKGSSTYVQNESGVLKIRGDVHVEN